MKIRLVSIDGKIADPLYNALMMEKAIEKAESDGVRLLIFPANSLSGISLDEVYNNLGYERKLDEARERVKLAIEKVESNVYVCFDGLCRFFLENKQFAISDFAQIETVEHLNEIEEYAKFYSKKNEDEYFIICHGRGTESVCQGVYSNVKIIAYNGKILASNLDTDSNVLDYELNDEISSTPYLDGISDYDKMFKNILNLQSIGLYNKMKSMNRFKICMGISGGLDSTVALLVCVKTFKKYGLPLKNIIGVTMPGLGTTERTHKNALELMSNLGITIEEIDLRPLLKTHLKNISQPEGIFDVTYEQCQSRERTQVLLDIANRDNAIMIGTGCMSEFALGWMTYGGDHLCMYAINIGLPKTVVKMYAKWFIDNWKDVAMPPENRSTKHIVIDIVNGPVSPELLPIDENGEQHEETENIIGDYRLQDFFIYHMIVNNYSITELFEAAVRAFKEYEPKVILKYLDVFTLRFFTRAYKKNCYGDGLQIFNYCVSPFNYHIPSDIDNTIWKEELEHLKEALGDK